MRTSALLVATMVLLPACQLVQQQRPAEVEYPADTEAGEIPFRFEGQGEAALIVPVYVNGEGPFDFVLDTGATMTCVEQALAQRLDLPEQRGAMGVGAGVGGVGRIELVRVDSIRVGGTRASGLTACVLDLAHIGAMGVELDGLLGLNFLRAYRVTLDFGRNVLTLEEPG
jgi:predicted aspartyl protease